MSHEIRATDKVAYLAGGVPWHGIGKPVAPEHAHDVPAALEAAGLDVRPILSPLMTAEQVPSDHQLVTYADAPGVPVATVGPRTKVPTPREIAERLQVFVEAGAKISTIMTMRGRKHWALVLALGETEIAPGDRLQNFLNVTWSVGNDLSLKTGESSTRIVCANTQRAFLNEGCTSIRKTASMMIRFDEAMAAVASAKANADKLASTLRAMTTIPVRKRSAVDAYIDAVFGKDSARKPDGTRTKLAETIETLQLRGAGSDLAHQRGTAFGAYSAVTEYLTHLHGRAPMSREGRERRLISNMAGPGAAMLSRAASDEALAALRDHAATTVTVPRGIPVDAVFGS